MSTDERPSRILDTAYDRLGATAGMRVGRLKKALESLPDGKITSLGAFTAGGATKKALGTLWGEEKAASNALGKRCASVLRPQTA